MDCYRNHPLNAYVPCRCSACAVLHLQELELFWRHSLLMEQDAFLKHLRAMEGR